MADKGPWADSFAGKRQMALEGPFERFQARVNPDLEFNRIDREWRAKWLKAQVLSPRDGTWMGEYMVRTNPDYLQKQYGRLRTAYRMPGNALEASFRGFMSPLMAGRTRIFLTYGLRAYIVGVAISYFSLYKVNDAYGAHGIRVAGSKEAIFPGHPEWPHNSSQAREKPEDYDWCKGKNTPYFD